MGSARGTNKKNKPSSKLSPKNMWEKLPGTKTQPPLTIKSDAAGDDVVVVDPYNPYDYAEGIAEILITNPDSLDHFLVTAEPDTVEPGQSAKLTVIAQNKDNKKVPIDQNILISLSTDSASYGRFVKAPGDTVDSPADSLRYGVLRQGSIQYHVNKDLE
ncbi:MAG: hypothetical protein P8X42_15500, partial [Calditrichaceae bacterium]